MLKRLCRLVCDPITQRVERTSMFVSMKIRWPKRCSSQALRSRESIVERTDGNSGRIKIVIKACGFEVQGTFPRACHMCYPVRVVRRVKCDERGSNIIMMMLYMCREHKIMSWYVCEHMHTCVHVEGYDEVWVSVQYECLRGLTPLCNYPFVTI